MGLVIGVIVLALAAAAYQVPRLMDQGDRWALVVFTRLLILATSLGVAHGLELPVPNPTNLLDRLFRPLTDMLFSFLGGSP